MKILIDTSSLISLVRYYLPFDKKSILFNFIKNSIENGDILVIDKVYDECKYFSKGIVVDTLPYIKEKKNQTKTEDILPNRTFFNQLDNQFINGTIKKKLNETEYENRKEEFLNSADVKLLLYCIHNKKDKLVIVTEETETGNDFKVFKKLPSICKILDIEVITLPKYLQKYGDMDFTFNR